MNSEQILTTILYEFNHVDYDALTQSEKKLLKMACRELGQELNIDEYGVIRVPPRK